MIFHSYVKLPEGNISVEYDLRRFAQTPCSGGISYHFHGDLTSGERMAIKIWQGGGSWLWKSWITKGISVMFIYWIYSQRSKQLVNDHRGLSLRYYPIHMGMIKSDEKNDSWLGSPMFPNHSRPCSLVWAQKPTSFVWHGTCWTSGSYLARGGESSPTIGPERCWLPSPEGFCRATMDPNNSRYMWWMSHIPRSPKKWSNQDPQDLQSPESWLVLVGFHRSNTCWVAELRLPDLSSIFHHAKKLGCDLSNGLGGCRIAQIRRFEGAEHLDMVGCNLLFGIST